MRVAITSIRRGDTAEKAVEPQRHREHRGTKPPILFPFLLSVFPLCSLCLCGSSLLQSESMCGRYTLVRIADLSDLFPWITDDVPDAPPRYNIAPTQPILAVANDAPDRYDFFFWGLVP